MWIQWSYCATSWRVILRMRWRRPDNGAQAAVSKFAEWRGYTLLWRPTPELVERNPSLAGVSSTFPLISTTREAGWELTLEGQRRDLYSQHWHGLLPVGGGSGSPAPVAVGVPMGMECAWCRRELAAIIDLDSHAPQLTFLQIEGESLRIPVCRWCSYGGGNGPLFWRVNTTGEAQWCEANGLRPEVGAWYDDPTRSYEPAWVAMAYSLGPVRTDPYASLVPGMTSSRTDWVDCRNGSSILNILYVPNVASP